MSHGTGLSTSLNLSSFTEGTQKHLNNLVEAFEGSKAERDAKLLSLKTEPISRLAAVLVLLYEQDSHLRVLLTTRAKKLRTHGGETSLPGGKAEEADNDIFVTALREAHEEIGLPMHSPHVHIMGTLSFFPFHALIVTPVVALLSDNSVLSSLKAGDGEVEEIFSHPLEAILEPQLASKYDRLAEKGSLKWPHEPEYHHYIDYPVKALGGVTYRVHFYRTVATPITGITSDVLIMTAEMVYGKEPQIDRYAGDQLRTYEEIVEAYEANKAPTTYSVSDGHARK